MPVGPVAGVIQIPPAMVAAAEAAAQESMSTALQQAVLQQDAAAARTGGGGGHGGGRSKEAIDAMTRIAAGIDAKPTERVKTIAERQAEIERMKREAQQNPQQRDLADDSRKEQQKQQYERNPLLALF
ncbi:MAG: hypothetical protein ACREML_05725 [Vulcanimicrobiaceae bacterium]